MRRLLALLILLASSQPVYAQCPQTEDDFQRYFYSLIGRSVGTPANDWRQVIINANIPPGFGPGVRADATYPLFGLTQQWSGGPKARIFLPSAQADENGYYTRAIQYIEDMPGGVQGVDFRWSWTYIAGHAYSPVCQGSQPPAPTTPPPTPPPAPVNLGPVLAAIQELVERVMALEVLVKEHGGQLHEELRQLAARPIPEYSATLPLRLGTLTLRPKQ